MLARQHRLTSARDFADTIRRGRRAGTATLVAHLADTEPEAAPRVGVVVGKAVGGAVVRNQVKRRLRHVARQRLSTLPGGSVLVIRALPPAVDATSAALGTDMDRALGRIRHRTQDKGTA